MIKTNYQPPGPLGPEHGDEHDLDTVRAEVSETARGHDHQVGCIKCRITDVSQLGRLMYQTPIHGNGDCSRRRLNNDE